MFESCKIPAHKSQFYVCPTSAHVQKIGTKARTSITLFVPTETAHMWFASAKENFPFRCEGRYRAIGSQLDCYSWCGFPFRCLENDSADHIHILKYFLRTCNQTAGTDSFCSAQSTRIDSSQKQKYQGLRTQAPNCPWSWGKKGENPRSSGAGAKKTGSSPRGDHQTRPASEEGPNRHMTSWAIYVSPWKVESQRLVEDGPYWLALCIAPRKSGWSREMYAGGAGGRGWLECPFLNSLLRQVRSPALSPRRYARTDTLCGMPGRSQARAAPPHPSLSRPTSFSRGTRQGCVSKGVSFLSVYTHSLPLSRDRVPTLGGWGQDGKEQTGAVLCKSLLHSQIYGCLLLPSKQNCHSLKSVSARGGKEIRSSWTQL